MAHPSPGGQPGCRAYLIPGVGSVSWVDQDGDDFGPWEESGASLGDCLHIKVVGALLKHEVRAGIGGDGEELHVPVRETRGG